MKKLYFLSFLFCLNSAFALPLLTCKSQTKIEGWNGGTTNDFVRLTANVGSNSQLAKAVVKGAYESDMRNLTADKNYRPTSAANASFNRFSLLEDAWHFFSLLLPKQLMNQRGSFVGYLQITGEESYKGTLRLNCQIKR